MFRLIRNTNSIATVNRIPGKASKCMFSGKYWAIILVFFNIFISATSNSIAEDKGHFCDKYKISKFLQKRCHAKAYAKNDTAMTEIYMSTALTLDLTLGIKTTTMENMLAKLKADRRKNITYAVMLSECLKRAKIHKTSGIYLHCVKLEGKRHDELGNKMLKPIRYWNAVGFEKDLIARATKWASRFGFKVLKNEDFFVNLTVAHRQGKTYAFMLSRCFNQARKQKSAERLDKCLIFEEKVARKIGKKLN